MATDSGMPDFVRVLSLFVILKFADNVLTIPLLKCCIFKIIIYYFNFAWVVIYVRHLITLITTIYHSVL